MRALRTGIAVASGLLAVPVLGALPAHASAGNVITLVCGGTTYHAQVNGNGAWSPARDVASTAVFIPHAFGPTTFTVRDTSGTVVDTMTEPATTQGSGKQRNDLSCTYSLTFTSDGSGGAPPAGYTITISGSVTGQKSGA